MKYEFCAFTDPGLARANNEDSVTFDESTCLAVLADGMGGYNAGEVASGMATTFIRTELSRWLSQAGRHANAKEIQRAMEICVENANRAIFNAAHSNPQYAGMGTTLVMGVFQDARLMLGHIGDSRGYRLRDGELVQLTKDHSLLQEQVDAGLITPEQAAVSINRNLVTRAMGVEDAAILEVNECRVENGDIYLLCSDGLSDMIGAPEIAELLGANEALTQKAMRMIKIANQHGGRDNISVLLVRAGDAASKKGLLSRLWGG